MKRQIIALVACLLFAASNVSAKSLVLTLKNGTQVYYLLGGESNPMLRFVDGEVVVNADRYEFGSIKNFYISNTDDPNGIGQMVEERGIRFDSNILTLDTGKEQLVSICTCDGRELNACRRQIGGKTIINMNPLPQGIYIVTMGDTSLKILKK